MSKYYFISIVLLLTFSNCANHTNLVFEEELKHITNETTIIDMSTITHKDIKLSDIVESVRYLNLDNSMEATLQSTSKIMIVDTLLYVTDNVKLKCFSAISGKFIRNCVQKGRAANEILSLGDFDVDQTHLYVLDRTASKILFYNHDGIYIKSEKIPFRAHKFKVLDQSFIFNLAPFSLTNESQSSQIAITNKDYTVLNKYIPYGIRAVRDPYFTSGYYNFFSPILGNGIYEVGDSCLSMKYYVKLEKNIESVEQDAQAIYAKENDVLHMYKNPICNKNYLLQYMITTRELQGTLLIDLLKNKSVLVDKFINDRDDFLDDFNFGLIDGYNIKTDEFIGVMGVPHIADLRII